MSYTKVFSQLRAGMRFLQDPKMTLGPEFRVLVRVHESMLLLPAQRATVAYDDSASDPVHGGSGRTLGPWLSTAITTRS